MIKKLVTSLLLILLIVTVLRFYAATSAALISVNSINPVADQFLRQVVGLGANSFQIRFSTPSGPSLLPNSQVTPHLNIGTEASVSNGKGTFDAVLSFTDGNFRSYSLNVVSGNSGMSRQSYGNSLDAIIRAANNYAGVFNASYCHDFAQLVSAAASNGTLTAQNGNFALQIQNGSTLCATCYEKIAGQYTSLWQSMQIYVSCSGREAGLVTDVVDSMRAFHVATTNVTISESHAIAVASPYIQAYALENGQQVRSINASFGYGPDTGEQRGDSYAIYPYWAVTGFYDKPANVSNAMSYSVCMWADNGEISVNSPNGSFGPVQSGDPSPFLPLLLLPTFVVIVLLSLGVYLSRRSRRRRN